jgi:peptidyl-dipeptidase A
MCFSEEVAVVQPAKTNQDREASLSRFIGDLVAEIEPLMRTHNEAVWEANVTGDDGQQARAAEYGTRIRMVFARREPYGYLCGLRDAGGVADERLARQLELLIDAHRAQQLPADLIERTVRMEKALEGRFNAFRAELDGRRVTDNEIRMILHGSDDVGQRRRAWEASKQIGASVAGDLLDLVRLRNQGAREVGFDNYYEMMLTLDELDEGELFEVLDRLERGTRAPFQRYKSALDAGLAARFGVDAAALRPWHYADPFFQEAPPSDVNLDPRFEGKNLEHITRRFYEAIGFEIDDILERSDLYEKEGKCQHAFCMSMDREADVRVLCNVRSTAHWMNTMLHEFGHAVYDKYIDRSLPFLLREPAHMFATEASAMLFDRLSHDAAWLERYAGLPAEEAQALARRIQEAVRAKLLVLTRWCLVMCHMERALYRDPSANLNTVWWELVERFQMVPRPEGREGPDWASKIHFTVAPVYYQNYMLGEIMASQLERHLVEEVMGGPEARARYVSDPAVGRWLTDNLYRHGRSRNWRDTLRTATGRALDPEAFVRELAGS